MRHITEVFPNIQHISIHFDVKMSDGYIGSFDKGKDTKCDKAVDIIERVPGVIEAKIHKYEVRISKDDLFTWSSIIPSVLNIVNELFYDHETNCPACLPGDYPLFSFKGTMKRSDGELRGDFIDNIEWIPNPNWRETDYY